VFEPATAAVGCIPEHSSCLLCCVSLPAACGSLCCCRLAAQGGPKQPAAQKWLWLLLIPIIHLITSTPSAWRCPAKSSTRFPSKVSQHVLTEHLNEK
jgi:hypothetical protein